MNIINILENNRTLFLLIIGIFSLGVGSFLNVVIYRLPIILQKIWHNEALEILKQKIVSTPESFNLLIPRSHCPKCKTPISIWLNIPVISYLMLRGKCKTCKTSISLQYPFVEILTCITSIYIAYKFGFSYKTFSLLILTWGLIALIFIDFEHFILPDEITLPILWLGLLVNSVNTFTSSKNAILGAILGYASLWLIALIFKKIRKIEGMGHGDFKLFALFGAWMGWQALPFIAFVASLSGCIAGAYLVFVRKHDLQKPIPFGPFLATAGWFTFFLYDNVINLYKQIFIL